MWTVSGNVIHLRGLEKNVKKKTICKKKRQSVKNNKHTFLWTVMYNVIHLCGLFRATLYIYVDWKKHVTKRQFLKKTDNL